MQEHVKVDRALTKAKTKLQSAACKALLNQIGVRGETLNAVLARTGLDAGAYLTTYLSYVPGDADDCKGNPAASTHVFTQKVAICRPFMSATAGMAGVYLIHEMMHTLGYGEAPAFPGYPTPREITDMVAKACGTN